MRRIGWLATVLSFSALAGTPVALTPAQQQVILDSGTQFGQGTLSVGAGTINGTGGAAGVPSYNATPSTESPGDVGLAGSAATKQAGCNGYTAPVGAGQVANQQDCSAVDFLTKNPNPAAAYPINPKTDPTIQAGAGVLQSASNGTAFQAGGVAAGGASTTVTGAAGVTGATTQTGCTTTTTTTAPAVTTTQTCYSASTLSNQTCDKTLSASVVMTSVCTVSGSFTALAPSGAYDVIFGCVNSSMASVTVSINPSIQCHSYGCNSTYYPMTLDFMPGVNATTTKSLAINYKGYAWETTTVTYVAATNSIQISDGNPLISSTTTSCPAGTSSGGIVTGLFGTKSYQSYMVTDNNGDSINVCVPAPSCPAGTNSGGIVTGFFGTQSYQPYMVTDNNGDSINVCAPAPSCPAGTSSGGIGTGFFGIQSYQPYMVTDNNGDSINVCAAANYQVVPFLGGISIQPVVTSTLNDNCTALQAMTQ